MLIVQSAVLFIKISSSKPDELRSSKVAIRECVELSMEAYKVSMVEARKVARITRCYRTPRSSSFS